MKYFKKSKSISLIIAVIMIMQLALPSSFTGAETTDIVPEKCIEKVTVLAEQADGSKKDITEITDYEPQNGDSVTIKIDIELDAGHAYGDGSQLTYELPSIFTDLSGSGNMGTVGTFKIEGGKVVVTFNATIRDDANQGLAVKDASLSIGAKYSENNELLEYVLNLPGQEEIKLNFKPAVGNSITKTGKAENNGVSSNYVSWVVDVNTELNTLSNASFKDVLTQGNPGKHTYIQDSLTVFELDVNAKGEIAANPTTPAAITAVYNTEKTELSFALPDGKKAYRISYNTKINENDSDSGSATYKNTSTITNNGIPKSTSASASVTWGTPLQKSVVRSNIYGASADWTVKYNYNRKIIEAAKAVLTDKITGNHIIDESGVKVYDEKNNLIDSSFYTVVIDSDRKGYTLSFNQEVKEPYQIKYTTIKSDYFVAGGTISNTVTRANDLKKSTSSFTYSNPAIVKSAKSIDYNNKTITWEIKVNQDSYPMKNLVITDTYAGEGMLYKSGTLNVTGLTAEQYSFTDNGASGFTFALTPELTINTSFTITFTTDYKINDVGTNTRTYKNTSAVKWNAAEKEYNSSSTAEAVMNANQKANGYKNGVYNYETKEFKWTAVINFNKNTLADALFKDSLPEGQEVVATSIVVKPVTLNTGGTVDTRGTAITPLAVTINSTKNAFEISLGNITGPYEITYTSVDADGFLPKTTGNVKVKNNAELFDGTLKNSGFSAEVTVAYTNETIKKEGSGFNSSSLINWNFKLNYSQSEISDVNVLDTVGKDSDGNPNQLILMDSFKVYEVKLKGEMNSGTPTETKTLVTDDIYEVNVDNINGTFTLAFNQPISKAYYIEYQSIFLGAPNESISNTAKLTYNGEIKSFEEITSKNFSYWFSGSGSTKKVQLKLVKIDEKSGEKLKGAEFSLYNSNNIKLMEGTTDENGELLFPLKLGEGKYNLAEVKAPEGYLKNGNQEIELKVSSSTNGVQTATVKNTKIHQAIELTKTDEGNNPLEGVEFELRMNDGQGNYNVVSGYENLKTNTEGKIYVGDSLTPGNYQLIETKAKDGYWLDTNPIDFNVMKDQITPTSKTVVNTRQGNLIIKKVDAADQKPLIGAVFKLYLNYDTAFDEPLFISSASDEDGFAIFTNVKYGDYILKEITAPEGYVVNLEDYANNITINSESKEVIIENELINQAVRLTKVDSEDSSIKLSGAKFTLHKQDGTLVTKDKNGFDFPEKFITGENGEITLNNLISGIYYFMETEAPEYYLLSAEENQRKTDEFSIIAGQTVFTDVKKENTRGIGDIIITKVDDADNSVLINDVVFTLKKGDLVVRAKTTVDGKAEFTGLPYGQYTLTETTANESYVLNNSPLSILLDGNTDGIKIELTIENTKKDYSVKLVKYNASKSQKLSGAVFQLKKQIDSVYVVVEGIDDAKLTTDENGEISLKDLGEGKYQLIETKAPSGYRLNIDPVEFEITENQTVPVEVEKINSKSSSGGGGQTNTPVEPVTPVDPVTPVEPVVPVVTPNNKVANIFINKIDSDSNPLQGAEFIVYDEKNEVIRTVVSDENGKVLFDNLTFGKYFVKETSAPEGYELISDVKIIEITESKTYSYNFINVLSEALIDDPDVPKGWENIEDPIVPEGQVTLPDTGSILNTWILIAIGIMLILAGAVMIKRKIIG